MAGCVKAPRFSYQKIAVRISSRVDRGPFFLYIVGTMNTIMTATDAQTTAVPSEFQRLLEDRRYLTVPKVGDVVKGRVVSVSKAEVHLDINGYRSGLIRGRELYNESDEYGSLNVGDEVEATVLELENEMGKLELSFRFAGQKKSWEELGVLQASGETVEAEVIEANKGGLLVRLGHLDGFLPVSQLNQDHYPRVPGGDKSRIFEKLKEFVGQKLKVKVLDANSKEEKLIVSEKKIEEDNQIERIGAHRVGEVVEGPITAITDFGAFLEFDSGITGLIHISELAWQRIEHPSEVAKIGDTVKAEIININGPKVFLSTKRLTPDPWKNVEERYKVGQEVKGKVRKVNSFGLFVELDPQIHGLAHISELGMKAEDLQKIKPGDELDFTVVSLKPAEYRLGLSLLKNSKETTPAEPATA